MESADAPVSPPTSPVKLPRDGSISIVLDWDDTLLPTTQLTDNYGDYITGGAPLPAHIVEELSALEDIAVEFLDEVAACGEATVITNAMNGWVTLSGRLFIPRVLQALSRHNIDVTYAREQHGNVGDAEEWKMTAFSTLVHEAPEPPHLVSIGDSVFERNAAHFAAKEYSAASVKTVKLIDPWEGPTIAQLGAQLRHLTATLRETVLADEPADLEMEFNGSEVALLGCRGTVSGGETYNPSACGEYRAV